MRILTLLCLLLLPLSASAAVEYLEQETPAGNVPPVFNQGSPSTAQGLMETYQAPAVIQAGAATDSSAQDEFINLYAQQNKPRMAIYFNRSLSDQIEDWRSTERLVNSGSIDGNLKMDKTNQETGKENLQADIALQGKQTLTVEKSVTDPRRRRLNENWAWQLEDEFYSCFIEAGARLIDRATILRLTGSKQQDTLKRGERLSFKQVEMKALEGYSDILIELLVAQKPDRKGIYRIKATAKDIATGQILAIASVPRAKDKQLARELSTYKATAKGFVPQAPADQTGEILADEMMVSFANYWRH